MTSKTLLSYLGKAKDAFVSISRVLPILNHDTKKKLLLSIIVHSFLNILDMFSILLTGFLVGLVVVVLQSSIQSSNQIQILKLLNLDNFGIEIQITILSILVVSGLVIKTLCAAIYTRKLFKFISLEGARISIDLLSKMVNSFDDAINRKSMNDKIYASTRGIEIISGQILPNAVLLYADVSMLILISIGLFVVSPVVATFVFLYFGMISVLLHKVMRQSAERHGNIVARSVLDSNNLIQDILATHKELYVSNRYEFFLSRLSSYRLSLAKSDQYLNFLPYVSKYIFEITIILGALCIVFVQSLFSDFVTSLSALSLFLVSSTRVGPAFLRIQQGFISFAANIGRIDPTLDIFESLNTKERQRSNDFSEANINFVSEIELDNVSFRHANSSKFAVKELSFRVFPNEKLAIVGPSGSGKSTILDLILGINKPSEGVVSISGIPPVDAFRKWSGKVAYVPQKSTLQNQNLRDNVTFGEAESEFNEKRFETVLQLCGLIDVEFDFVRDSSFKLGENGRNLSGGERQRVAIARALYQNPSLLIIDEGTSALDQSSEEKIVTNLLTKVQELTLILVTHRISATKNFDRIILISNGQIQKQGNFFTLFGT